VSLSKINEFSRSQAVVFTSKVVVSKKTVLYINKVTTGHLQEVIYGLFKSTNCDDLGCIYVKVIYQLQIFAIFFSNGMIRVARFLLTSASRGLSAIAELFVKIQ